MPTSKSLKRLGEPVEFGDADHPPAAVAVDLDFVGVHRGSGCDSAVAAKTPTLDRILKHCNPRDTKRLDGAHDFAGRNPTVER
jgi:hypothetical protein